jgi:hypothetical protein
MMSDPAWNMLRDNYIPDSKGRYKTVHAMGVAKHFAKETERLKIFQRTIIHMCSVRYEDVDEYIRIAKQAVADYEARL